MKYSAVVLACVLAIAAAADYNNGQYIPEKQYNNKYNQYKPYRYQQYQNNPYKPYVSSTPFPSKFVSSTPYPSQFVSSTSYPSQFVSSTPVPVTVAPARSTVYYSSSTPKPVFNIPALPSRSVSVEAAKPAVVSAFPSRSAFPARASLPTPSWSSRASWPSAKAESPVAPTQASLSASVSKFEAPVVSIASAARVAPAVQVAPVAPVVSVTPVAPVAQIYPSAKMAVPATRWAGDAGAAQTLKYSNQINNDGDFQYSYETNNGIYAQESGSHRSFYNGDEQVSPVVAQGSFGWMSPEGQQISMSYVADELGYRPTGPQVHPQLARALEYLASRNLHVSH